MIVFGARSLSLASNYFEANSHRSLTMAPEGDALGSSGWGNLTTTADVVITGCPSFNDGSGWIGQPDAPGRRFPRWCYGNSYPSGALLYTGNFHSVAGTHAVLAIALENAKFQGNSYGDDYEVSRVHQSLPLRQACGLRLPPRGTAASWPALVGFGTEPSLFLARHITFESNDQWCYQAPAPATTGSNDITASAVVPAGLSNGGVLALLLPSNQTRVARYGK